MNSNIAYTPMMYTDQGIPVSTNSVPGENDRFFGGFFGPFILGGITGGLLAPAFSGGYGYGRPSYYSNYNNYYYPPYYYPYGSYYY